MSAGSKLILRPNGPSISIKLAQQIYQRIDSSTAQKLAEIAIRYTVISDGYQKILIN